MNVSKTKQIVISTPDQAGELAKVLDVIAGGAVNGIAYAGYADAGQGHIMLVADDNDKACTLLQAAGYSVDQREVVVVRDSDVQGSASTIAKKVADAGISLIQVYATSSGGEYVTVLQAADTDQLLAALQ